MNLTSALATQFQLKEWQVEQVVTLLEEGNTIPFIARYRKEAHGSWMTKRSGNCPNVWIISVL